MGRVLLQGALRKADRTPCDVCARKAPALLAPIWDEAIAICNRCYERIDPQVGRIRNTAGFAGDHISEAEAARRYWQLHGKTA